MNFRTIADVANEADPIDHTDGIVMLGSCFTEAIGMRLRNSLFDVEINPFGPLYNPESISKVLLRLMSGEPYSADDLFFHDGLWHSFDHHSRFSRADRNEAVSLINTCFLRASDKLKSARHLIITFGTAYVYRLADTGHTVGNCHKLTAARFCRKRLSAKEIADCWTGLIPELRRTNANLSVTFTVSPIRHIADGLHGNNISKAELLLATDRIIDASEGCSYFPAYEIVTDELRDYRFYAADMLHPSDVAADYVMERFADARFSPATRSLANECRRLTLRLAHRPLTDNRDAIRKFNEETQLAAKKLTEKVPHLNRLIDNYFNNGLLNI